MFTDIEDLLNAIPIAEHGHVITSEYHNSLRDALRGLAQQFDTEAASQTVTLTWSPAFFPNDPQPNWSHRYGLAFFKPGKQYSTIALRATNASTLGTTDLDESQFKDLLKQLNVPEESQTLYLKVVEDYAQTHPDSLSAFIRALAIFARENPNAKSDEIAQAIKAIQEKLGEADVAPNEATPGCEGWFPVQLPHGVLIQQLLVTGEKQGEANSFQVLLVRQPLALKLSSKRRIATNASRTFGSASQAALGTPLIRVDLTDTDEGPFAVKEEFNAVGLAPSEVASYRRVDNKQYKYLIAAEFSGAQTTSTAALMAIQLTCRRA